MDKPRPPSTAGAGRARSVRLGLIVAVLAGGAAFVLLPVALRGFVWTIELLLDACIWCAMSLSAGTSAGSMLGSLGRAFAALIVSPQGSGVLAALVLVPAVALYVLQRLLGSEEEPW
jgi:hypothetical protein